MIFFPSVSEEAGRLDAVWRMSESTVVLQKTFWPPKRATVCAVLPVIKHVKVNLR